MNQNSTQNVFWTKKVCWVHSSVSYLQGYSSHLSGCILGMVNWDESLGKKQSNSHEDLKDLATKGDIWASLFAATTIWIWNSVVKCTIAPYGFVVDFFFKVM